MNIIFFISLLSMSLLSSCETSASEFLQKLFRSARPILHAVSRNYFPSKTKLGSRSFSSNSFKSSSQHPFFQDVQESLEDSSPSHSKIQHQIHKNTNTFTKNNSYQLSVAAYLKMRLQELGLTRLFGVAGNYTAPFLDTILEDPSCGIKITGISNKLCAGYAADGYARSQGVNGIGAVAVTYGVGALSLLNAVVGSYIEQVPVVVINGAPTKKQFSNQRFVGLLYSHALYDVNSNINVYRPVTVAAERIVNAHEAHLQIDAALTACITHQQPVYLEISEDIWRAECKISLPLTSLSRTQSSKVISNVTEAVQETLKLIRSSHNKKKSKPMFWVGSEVQRFGLQSVFLNLLRQSGFQYTTSF